MAQCSSEKFAGYINSVIRAESKSRRHSQRQFTWSNFQATNSCSRSLAVPSLSLPRFGRLGTLPYAAARRLLLELGAARGAREGNYIANVGNAGDEHQHAFKTEPEAGMWHRSVAAQIEVPFVIGGIHIVPPHIVL